MRSLVVFVAGILVGILAMQPSAAELLELTPDSLQRKAMDGWK